MGTSKIVMLSGLYIIIGLYTMGFNSADQTVRDASLSQAMTAQAEQLAYTGVKLEIGDMETFWASAADWNTFHSYSYSGYFYETGLSFNGGTIDYSVVPTSSTTATITATGHSTSGTSTTSVTVIAHVTWVAGTPDYPVDQRVNNRWKVDNVFVQPS
jgi:hypothetical protein